MTYGQLYEMGKKELETAGVGEAALDARLLLEFVCRTKRHDLLAHGDRPIAQEEEKRYRELIGSRASRIPLQHLTGVQEFMGLEFHVGPEALIPRQDTEILVEEVLRELHDGFRILDLCTRLRLYFIEPSALFQWLRRDRHRHFRPGAGIGTKKCADAGRRGGGVPGERSVRKSRRTV